MKTKVETSDAPKATGPFSQAVVEGNLVFGGGGVVSIYCTRLV